MRKKLKEAVHTRTLVKIEVKPALYADKCDCCGKLFTLDKYCNDKLSPGDMQGTFDQSSGSKGNMFFATVCSMDCAAKIFNGGWKDMRGYKSYAKEGATLVRIELGMTSLFKSEEELVSEWNDRPATADTPYIT